MASIGSRFSYLESMGTIVKANDCSSIRKRKSRLLPAGLLPAYPTPALLRVKRTRECSF
jgi:hypothetical protein